MRFFLSNKAVRRREVSSCTCLIIDSRAKVLELPARSQAISGGGGAGGEEGEGREKKSRPVKRSEIREDEKDERSKLGEAEENEV